MVSTIFYRVRNYRWARFFKKIVSIHQILHVGRTKGEYIGFTDYYTNCRPCPTFLMGLYHLLECRTRATMSIKMQMAL